eukprot:CAMPEP_0177578620 /NCGR_PEP_ID=MMETSP0419_2-20121207/453_1 /TAXON_ID=582737 /ORGANISM="Tetraselmis sp., Strain GSL018" /LENGTH=56 /DNA_ID=CAMNT_0019067091 /DNA_START=264 /DNA_END=434 /DNA_ORIENTATION=-
MGGSGGPPFQETPGTIPRSNIGFQLLQKSGWEQGQGLGASEQVQPPLSLFFPPMIV